MLVISDEDRLGDALSGLPLIYHLAQYEASLGRRLNLAFKNRDVLSLMVPAVKEKLALAEDLADLWTLEPRLAEQRVMHLYVYACHVRYGRRYHMMYSHFVNHGFYPDHWRPPQLDFTPGASLPVFDFIVAPYSRSDSKNNKIWPFERWQEVLDMLATRFSVCVLGAGDDPRVFKDVSYYFDEPLRDVCGLLSNATRGILSIDNGISHLAHALGVPHFMIYPVNNAPEWVRNTNENAYRIIGQPLEISVAEIIRGIEPLVGDRGLSRGSGEPAR